MQRLTKSLSQREDNTGQAGFAQKSLLGTALPHPCGKPAAYRYSNLNIRLCLYCSIFEA
jgi:hypothetical protein